MWGNPYKRKSFHDFIELFKTTIARGKAEINQIKVWRAEFLLILGKAKQAIKILEKVDSFEYVDCWIASAFVIMEDYEKAQKILTRYLKNSREIMKPLFG